VADEDELARKGETQRAARAAGLAGNPQLSLADIDRRRSQLWSLSLIVIVVLSAAVAVLSLSGRVTFRSLGLADREWVAAVLVLGLAFAFLIYVYEKDRNLRRLTDLLVEERILSTALSSRLTEVSSLTDIAKALTTTLDLKGVLDLILTSALDLLGGSEGSVMLLADGGYLEVVAYKGPSSDRVLHGRTRLGKGISGRVADTRRPALLQGSELGGDFAGEGHPERDIFSSMSVPLVRRDQLVGVLNLTESRGERRYTEADLQGLEVFAAHAAIAIGNARLFEGERQAVARLEELDRLKSDFVATVSHELKTPLTAIIGAAKTVSRKGPSMNPTQHEEFMGMIERQGSRLLRLVEDVLTTARIESGQRRLRRELVDMRAAVEPLIDELHLTGLGHGREIELRTEPERPEVWGDLSAMQQIAGNLLENALKYGAEGTKVVITLTELPGESVIEVTDQGPGLTKEEIDMIFERFHQVDSSSTREVGGVGLGLFIVKSLVDAHRGRIDVTSEVGMGTTFKVIFPKRSSDRER
jgi:two-component system, OmpR family, sensor histidine kinase KdpD